MKALSTLLKEISQCSVCADNLPFGPRPVLSASKTSRILIIGQAPGRKVHESGIPWDDASGERLRDWLGVEQEEFYDPSLVALVPMGFCYPGTGKSGDLPPRKECAALWHEQILSRMKNVELTVLLSRYAQDYYLGKKKKSTLTETVKSWKEYLPQFLPLPHPSPRNNIWLKKNPWFEKSLVPELQRRVRRVLGES